MGDNVDMKDIYPYAKSAEDMYIQEAIGTPLYDRLIAGLTASPQDITANETALLRIIRSAMVYWTCYDALPYMWIKLRNIGLVKQSGDNLETVSEQEMAVVRKELKNKADFYMKRLQDYLCENRELFSEYGGNYLWSDLYPNTNVSNSSDVAIPNNFDRKNSLLRFIPR